MQRYHSLIDGFVRTRIGGWTLVHVFHTLDKRLMRWTNGALSSGLGTDFQGNVVLLCCTGAKSGKLREIPLLMTPFGDQFVLVASSAGRDQNPAWYYNLKANPVCSLLIPNRGDLTCIAHEAEGAERERAWVAANVQYSGYTTYQSRTKRQIPVMILTP